jgi:hypothetical protein
MEDIPDQLSDLGGFLLFCQNEMEKDPLSLPILGRKED